ncbi:MAG: type II secretion system F family protein [Patescibacteria group bacterium]
MKYKYQAKSKTGEMQVGFVDAIDKDSAANILASHDLFILYLESADKRRWYEGLASYFERVKRKDMVIFTRQLAVLLEARLPLNTALKTLHDQTNQPTLKETVYQISEDIDAGLAFSQALERHPAVFSNFFISMVRSSEVTGNLNEVAGFLADYTEKEDLLVTKARSAMIYPAIVIGLFVVVSIILITVVFPQLKPVFEQSGAELPFLTKLLINSGDIAGRWWPAIALIVGIFFIIIVDYVKSPEGRAFWDELKTRLPIVSKVHVPVTITRFSNAAAILLKGGVPLAQSIEIVSQTIDNVLYQDILREVAEEIRQGVPLSEAISKYPDYFPPLVPQMLVVGESTGQLDKMFMRIAVFYNREADNVINNIVDLIQPILMIGIGVMVAFLFAAVLLPIYKLTATFGSS